MMPAIQSDFSHQVSTLPDGRLHLQDGPIDLIIGIEGDAAAVRMARAKACRRFDGLLSELVAELPALRSPVTEHDPALEGVVARRMLAAARPHCAILVTPMAAVAGAVADEILAAITATPGLAKVFVNNGGDIAVYLAPGQRLRIGAVSSLATTIPDGFVTLTGNDDIRGIATSGAQGRSFSRGIADAVTVLARNAAAADVAATLIGNAVDIDHPAITRAPAASLDPDCDLGERLVTLRVGDLSADSVAQALDHGVAVARTMLDRNLICGGLLSLRDQTRVVGCINALNDLNKE